MIGDDGNSTNHSVRLFASGNVSSPTVDPVRLRVRESGTQSVSTTTGYTVNVWHHAFCVMVDAEDKSAFIDGGSKSTNVNAQTPTTHDEFSIGELSNGGDNFHGLIAEAAMWDAALTDAQVAILALGYSPLFVRPQNLLAYWPLVGRTSPEIDTVGGNNLTVTGATAAAHTRMIYPAMPRITVPVAAVGPTVPDDTLAATQSQMNSGGMVGTVYVKPRDRIYVPVELGE